MARILVVEDEPATAADIAEVLTLDQHEIESAASGLDALAILQISSFDVIVLDWNLPGKTGLQVMQEYRARGGTTPILMLTGMDQIQDKEAGLDSGADDYLTKPFHVRELRARVKALTRRGHQYTDGQIRYKNLELDVAQHSLRVGGEPVSLNVREFSLLELLLRNQDQVFSLDALISRVWAADNDVTYDAVRQCVARVRKKIDTDGGTSIINTIAGIGYKIDRAKQE